MTRRQVAPRTHTASLGRWPGRKWRAWRWCSALESCMSVSIENRGPE
jgi:hypothetical protein